MLFLLTSLEFVELIYRIQTSKNYSFLSLNKQMFLFVKTKYFCYSLLDLNIEAFLLCLNRLLVGHKEYLILLAIIISLVLSGVFSAPSILGIRNNHIAAGLAIKVDRFLTTGTRGYLVSVLF
jgi:hypothetical protein